MKQLVKNNFLKIKFDGDPGNRHGHGAKVILYSDNSKYYQEQMPVRGFQSSVEPVLNFGVGQTAVVDSLVVIWPNDKMQTLKNVKTNQTVSLNIKDAGAMTWFMILQHLRQNILHPSRHSILHIRKINSMILLYKLYCSIIYPARDPVW